MWSVREALEKFIQSLELTPKQQEEVIHQHKLVREALQRRLKLKDIFLSGSYSRNTAIRPLHDIDLFVVLDEAASSQAITPDSVLKQVRQALKEEWPGKELPILQQHSVRLEFLTKDLQFDVVPALAQPGQELYRIPERHLNAEPRPSRWIDTNPRRHQKRSTEANEQAGKKLKPLLKAVKHWNHHASSPLRSFHLEVMSYSAFPQPPQGGYLEALELLFSHLSRQVTRSSQDPAGLGPNVDEGMSSTQREAARQLLESAARTVRLALEEEKSAPAQAHARLRGLFGDSYRDR